LDKHCTTTSSSSLAFGSSNFLHIVLGLDFTEFFWILDLNKIHRSSRFDIGDLVRSFRLLHCHCQNHEVKGNRICYKQRKGLREDAGDDIVGCGVVVGERFENGRSLGYERTRFGGGK
jgi:hypothetical protein